MTVPARELRAWAEGDYPTEAAVEILIRAKAGRFARDTCPWIEPLGPPSSLYRVNWDQLHQEAGVFSSGERRILNLATSMGSPDHPVDLSNDLSGLDDDLLLLVLAATAHAAGRPRLLSPATAVATRPAPRTTDPVTPSAVDQDDGQRTNDGSSAPAERHEGPRP